MTLPQGGRLIVLMMLGFASWTSAAAAQTGVSGSIAGVVRDATGGILPGVTVEASSPSLIEKVRTAVTDSQGQYRIVDLRPGSYRITFTLPGFSVVSRDGVELTTGCTATVNAELRVGSIEETVEVTGESPIVDIQNARTQNVLSRELLDSAPIPRTLGSFAMVTVGVEGGRPIGGGPRDSVGGSRGESLAGFEARGDRQGLPFIEGLRIGASIHDGSTTRFAVNQLMAQEVVLETSGAGAESEGGGINVNIVFKDGGNLFSGVFNTDYTGRNLQSSNLSDELRARGVSNSNVVVKLYDVGGGLGGPLVRDKLWFYTAHRKWGGLTELAGKYFNATQETLFYTPDPSRPGTTDVYFRDNTVRLTFQASAKHKITGTAAIQEHCVCNYQNTATNAQEASFEWHFKPVSFYQANWTYPATNRLLFEAGGSYKQDRMLNTPVPEARNRTLPPVLELSTGINYGSTWTTGSWYSHLGDHGDSPTSSYKAAMSYITGSHAFKTGLTLVQGIARIAGSPPDVRYVFRNQLPNALDQILSPNFGESRLKYSMGIYGQDQWTVRRMTINAGVRLDLLNEYNPAQTRPGGLFAPDFHFDARYNVPNWKDISPRLGFVYDLFGDGRTALKVGLNRYVAIEGTRISAQNNASSAVAYFTRRTWNDANGDFVPNCDLKSKAANGECGAMANQNFGTSVINQTYDADVLDGWDARNYNWQTIASVSHQLAPGVGLQVSYFRTWWGNFRVVRNMATSASDYDPFCVTAPVDSRLPGGGGYEVCGAYDIKPAKFGESSLLVKQAEGEGLDISRVYNGIEAIVNARFGRGYFSGGISTGRQISDICSMRNRPDLILDDFTMRSESPMPDTNGVGCRVSPPLSALTQIKFNGMYPLWWGIQAAAVLQNLPGIHTGADAVFANAAIAPSLGRNLGACGTAAVCNATATVRIVAPGELYEPRQTQVDFRFSKEVAVGRARLRPRIDLNNVFNANSVQVVVSRYGPNWLRPSDVMNGRIVKFGAQLDF